ncbi:MAG TPA: hypothetical protein VMY88_10250 [Acidimicrobiales bacterium]|nr:hypothetical protein [Acidimicrobiales bacterium]
MIAGPAGGRDRKASRDYPPLVVAGLLMLLILGVLPSSLNLPQENPSETLEYAPVPPEDQDEPPPAGNFASLGLGTSSGLSASAEGGDASGGAGGEVGGRAVKTPSTKRCVGTPPRQTEDPLSPPCVAVFNGDNGGSTYNGVTADEIRILMYFNGGGRWCNYGDEGCPAGPVDKLFDLAQPPADDEFYHLEFYRNWQRYFNERFQTYGRLVHFYVYYNNTLTNPETRRADAASMLDRVKPFAVIDFVYGNSDVFVDAMARRGVMNFGGTALRTEAAYRRHPGLVWSFAPTVERMARSFSSFLCTKVQPFGASFSGNEGQNGTPRVYGLLHTSDPGQSQYLALNQLVREQAESCGIQFAAEGTYPACYVLAGTGGNRDEAVIMADFQQKGVTTIIWPGCYEGNMTHAASAANYYPEWITTDYRGMERSETGLVVQEKKEWTNAWVVTPQTFQNADLLPIEPACLDAYTSVDPKVDRESFDLTTACKVYRDLRQLFIGIQVAGPRLDPKSVEKGYRAIPDKPSPSRDQVSCYYEPGEYTCDKDAVAQWWDPNAAGVNRGGVAPIKGLPGCYRMGDDGRRYRPGEWPEGDVLTMKAPDQVCNLSNEQ